MPEIFLVYCFWESKISNLYMEDGIIWLVTQKEMPITTYITLGNWCKVIGCSRFVKEGEHTKWNVVIWVMFWIWNDLGERVGSQEDRKHAWAEVIAKISSQQLEPCPQMMMHTKDQNFHALPYYRDLQPSSNCCFLSSRQTHPWNLGLQGGIN